MLTKVPSVKRSVDQHHHGAQQASHQEPYHLVLAHQRNLHHDPLESWARVNLEDDNHHHMSKGFQLHWQPWIDQTLNIVTAHTMNKYAEHYL